MLVDMTLWVFLLFAALGILGCMVAAMRPSKETLKQAFMLGLFLAIFDFAFENWGAVQGLWFSSGSLFLLWNVPAEVFIIAITAGMAFHLLFPPRKDALYIIATSLLIAVAGTGIETLLIDHKLLTYAGGWTSVHALASYFVTLVIVHFANLKLQGHRVFHDNTEPKKRKARK